MNVVFFSLILTKYNIITLKSPDIIMSEDTFHVKLIRLRISHMNCLYCTDRSFGDL